MRLLFRVVSRFTVQSLIFTQKSLLYTPKYRAALVSTRGTARGAGIGGGVPWMAWRRPWSHARFKSGVHFNLPTQLPIPDPSPDPVPAGEWGADLCGSLLNRTSQRRLQFDRLPTPVLAKGILSFSLP